MFKPAVSNLLLKKYQKQNIHQPKFSYAPIHYSDAVMQQYYLHLKSICERIHKDALAALIPAYQQTQKKNYEYSKDGWSDFITKAFHGLQDNFVSYNFNRIRHSFSQQFVQQADNYHMQQARKSFSVNFYAEESTQEFLKLAINNNVNLITSIPEVYLQQLEQQLLKLITNNGSVADLQSLLENQYNLVEKRAKFIAVDQTLKLNGQLTARRHIQAGIQMFQWIPVKDNRLRHTHKELSVRRTELGTGTYRWDTPPVSLDGKAILPAEEYQCRCVAKPVVKA